MNTNQQLDLAAFLADHPVFSLQDLARARGDERTDAARNQLKHHLNTGRVKSVARGIYAAVPPGVDAEGFQPDRYLVAATARHDGVFAYHAALELLGAAHSLWSQCVLHCLTRRQPINLRNVRIVFLATPRSLSKQGLHDLGIREVPHETRRLSVTGPERTLVEGFRRPQRVGGLAELIESASGFSALDFDLLQSILEAYDQRSLWAAVGWFVERQSEAWLPSRSFVDLCRQQRPSGYQYLIRGRREGHALPDWNLIIPETLSRELIADDADT